MLLDKVYVKKKKQLTAGFVLCLTFNQTHFILAESEKYDSLHNV